MGVDLFFVISGVVISLVTTGKFKNARAACIFLYHRLARIYPVFWFYFALAVLLYVLNPNLINSSAGHHLSFFQDFFLIPNQYPNLLSPAWTLSHELTFYAVFFALMLLVPERHSAAFLLVWAAGIGAIGILGIDFHLPLIGILWSPYNLEFVTGCLLFRVYNHVQLHPKFGEMLLILSMGWLGVITYFSARSGANSAAWVELKAMSGSGLGFMAYSRFYSSGVALKSSENSASDGYLRSNPLVIGLTQFTCRTCL